ncbi:DUF4352 domain-containing protein [Hymenobacter koreensis]
MLHYYRSALLLGLLAFAACSSPSESATAETDATEETTAEAEAAETTPAETPAAPAAAAAADGEPHLTAGAKKELYAVGDVALVDSLLVRVNSVKTATEGDFGNKPKAGHEYVVVNMTWENGTSKLRDLSTLMHTMVLDANGKEIMATAGTSMETATQLDRSRAPGKSGTGPIYYQVPANAKGLKWVFRKVDGSALDLKESGRAVYDLGL